MIRKNKWNRVAAILSLSAVMALTPWQQTYAAADDKENEAADSKTDETAEALKACTKQVSDDDVIPNGTSIAGQDVSGKTVAEAQKVLEDYADEFADAKFTLKADDRSVTVSAKDLGLCAGNSDVVKDAANYLNEGNLLELYDVRQKVDAGEVKNFDVSLTCTASKVIKYLDSKSESLNLPVVNASLSHENGEFQYVEGTVGVEVDSVQSAIKIGNYISTEWDGKDAEIDLVTSKVEPEGDKKSLRSIKDNLGTYSTNFGGSAAGRVANIKNAVSKLNGTVLYPGEQISVYNAAGPLNAANGYELAGAYENGKSIQDYGGGICQVSTTLYNAVIRAELQIDERHPHSMTVHYVKPSEDAAIAGGAKDFKFTNDQDTPIYIEGLVSGSNLTFTIYGKETREAGREVTYVSEVLETLTPNARYVVSGGAAAGSISKTSESHTGYKAQLWKVVTVNGVEKSREVFNKSSYRKVDPEYVVGVAGMSAEDIAAVNAAVATGDGGAIRAAAAAGAANAAAAQAAADQAAAEAAAAAAAQPAQ